MVEYSSLFEGCEIYLKIPMNKLYFGSNLEILREIGDERVHLICTNP